MRKMVFLFTIVILGMSVLTGCGGNNDTIETCVVSNAEYMTKSELESANQKNVSIADESIYASIHFIESPKGTEYTVKWCLDGKEIKSETKETQNDMQDVIIYELEADQAKAGVLRVEVVYKDAILLSKEIEIQ